MFREGAVWRPAVALALVGVALCSGAGTASAAFDPPPPGANDWTCRPTPVHPRPVVLVHGLGATMAVNWSFLAPRLRAAGYCVFALTYGVDPRTAALPYAPGGVVAMERSAPALAAFVDFVRVLTGAREVDLVGHSEGTVMPRYYLSRLGGARAVRRFVSLAPLWRGTEVGGAAFLRDIGERLGIARPVIDLVAGLCGACPELLRGSPFLRDLNAGGEAVAGVSYTSIVTRYDELVVPYTSGILRAPGATNVVLQRVCPFDLSEHLALAFDPAVAALVLRALDPALAPPVSCLGARGGRTS